MGGTAPTRREGWSGADADEAGRVEWRASPGGMGVRTFVIILLIVVLVVTFSVGVYLMFKEKTMFGSRGENESRVETEGIHHVCSRPAVCLLLTWKGYFRHIQLCI
ncbi:hypothetical protein CYMTET_36028 [Cymbomonas tetramitiformis]|uniref:Uncharacterized protein n=1 Tax=Cymbomonas tetramitiformis TaxID=36881 RepID=A0AAE0F826_9CHLO|nr:hypothetical protein CYMTET_36028 [Cymbomonas tetramitiformis]